jgi:hypothetical protein
VRLIDLDENPAGHSAPITHVAFQPDGSRLAGSGRVYDAEGGAGGALGPDAADEQPGWHPAQQFLFVDHSSPRSAGASSTAVKSHCTSM